MSDNQNFSCLNEHREKLSSVLVSHVDELIKYFLQNSQLSESDVATVRKLDQQKAKVDHFMKIIIDKVGKGDGNDYFDKLVGFMRDSQDLSLSDLAKNMSFHYQDVDFIIPCVQPVMECEKQQLVTSTPSKFSSPNEVKSWDAQSESDLLTSVIQREEKRNNLFEIQFSTVLCVGLPKAGKTSFCNLLMGKGTQVVSSGNTHTIYIKKSSPSTPDKESKWKEINSDELLGIIHQLNHYKTSSLHVKNNKEQGIINDGEKWEVLLLLDYNIPSSALGLLQPSVVTFVTYKMLGGDFSFDNPCAFIKSENKFPKFVKKILASSCVTRESKFDELKISDECGDTRTSYTVFVGIMNDSASSGSYEKEKDVINRGLHAVKEHINCSSREFPLSFWYEGKDTYLYLVNLAEQKEQSIENLRKGLDRDIAQNSAHKMPIIWVLFYFKLCKLCFETKQSYAYYSVVFEDLWKAGCNNYSENEFKLALHFFHELGVLFYFDTVKGLKDYIFIDCLWIFEKLNYLLSGFEDSKHDYVAKEVLKHEGLLQSKIIKQIKFEGPGNMKLQTFVNLLKHLKYVAPLNQNDYFMPSILEVYKSSLDICKHYGSVQSTPLLVTFSSGSLHPSVFCYLAAYMMKTNKWEELKFKKQQHTFKDLIIFSIGIEQYVCISDKTFFLEIRLHSNSKSNVNWHNSMYKFIQQALGVVCHNLQLSAKDCKYGFLCHSCEVGEEDHMMVVEEYKDNCAYCCKGNKTKKLSTSHIVWFERSNSLPSPVHGQATDSIAEEVESSLGSLTTGISKNNDVMCELNSQPNISYTKVSNPGTERPVLKYLNRLRQDICSHWHDLGVELLDDNHVAALDSIFENNQKDVNRCCTKMFQLWLETSTSATWNDLLNALKGLKLCDLATKIESSLFKNPEQESQSSAVTKPEELTLQHNTSSTHGDSIDGPEDAKESSQESTCESTDGMEYPTLNNLNRLRKDICSHWHDLGVELLDDSHVATLDSIFENNQKDVNECCTKMFELWLETSATATWNDLLDALKQLQLCDLATKIETGHFKNPEQESQSSAYNKPEEINIGSQHNTSAHDSIDGPEDAKESSQESPSESTDGTSTNENGEDTQSPIKHSKAVLTKQNSIDDTRTKDMFKHSSTCKSDPVCAHDQKERPHSLSEGAASTVIKQSIDTVDDELDKSSTAS